MQLGAYKNCALTPMALAEVDMYLWKRNISTYLDKLPLHTQPESVGSWVSERAQFPILQEIETPGLKPEAVHGQSRAQKSLTLPNDV